jgi:hypothetical protein
MDGDIGVHVCQVSILARCVGLIRHESLRRCSLTSSASFACHDVVTKASFSAFISEVHTSLCVHYDESSFCC